MQVKISIKDEEIIKHLAKLSPEKFIHGWQMYRLYWTEAMIITEYRICGVLTKIFSQILMKP